MSSATAWPQDESTTAERLVDDKSVVIAVLSGLRLLARQARDRPTLAVMR
jgi:hypothetical protein